jgi:ATP/maltotriose-dependent transcriptional regulator MalT
VSQARFEKRQRERARQERAAAKAAKRVERGNSTTPEPQPQRDQAEVLAELAALHERFDAGLITFDDFEATKQELTEELDVG